MPVLTHRYGSEHLIYVQNICQRIASTYVTVI
jgi:hypothetical protein